MRKVGLYSGSFNPIHIGHLALANYLCEYGAFDEVWFVVSPTNPWKVDDQLLPDSLRLELVKLSIGDYPRFRASDFEFSLPQPSYTVNTLEALASAYPDIQFSLIIGADNWVRFDEWKGWQTIQERYEIYVFPRPDYPIDSSRPIPANVHITDTPLLDISSTFIRKAMDEHRDVRFFMQPRAWQRLCEYFSTTNNTN
jgi:nicotinate-nucleotide adenylyltransferase